MQGVVRTFDPQTGEGVVIRDTDRENVVFSPDALEGSILRNLRQGQRIIFELDDAGRATQVRLGAERDMGTPTAQV